MSHSSSHATDATSLEASAAAALSQDSSADESLNWLVDQQSNCHPLPVTELEIPDSPYRLYRFLTEMEDILESIADDTQRIQAIAPLVRKLLSSSYWLQMEYNQPKPDPGWAVRFLYREQQFPLTVQMVAWLPNNVSPIHNHGTWGLVALISGQERNQFWRRSPTPEHPDRLECVGEKILEPGEIIGFLPDAIHSVEPLGEEPAITFNLYGITDYKNRFRFDPTAHTAKPF